MLSGAIRRASREYLVCPAGLQHCSLPKHSTLAPARVRASCRDSYQLQPSAYMHTRPKLLHDLLHVTSAKSASHSAALQIPLTLPQLLHSGSLVQRPSLSLCAKAPTNRMHAGTEAMFGLRDPLPLHAPSSHTARLPRTPGAFLQHPTNAHPSEYLAMCLAVKDQHADIREWLEHHLRLGVGKFYIYDNNSSRPMLPEFFDLVRLCEWPGAAWPL